MSNVNILYEDNHLIAVFKPAGVLSQPDKSGDQNMLDEVKKYLKENYKKTGKVFVGLLHRLDRPVSGILLFAKTSKGASRVSEQFRNHVVEKIYHAIVLGKPKETRGVLVNSLIKDEKLRKGIEKEGVNKSKLYYEVVKSNAKYSLLKIRIETGKFHQIRAQLSFAGLPILGDVKYLPALTARQAGGRQVEGKWKNEKAIALCATSLHFQTATGEKRVTLSIEIPKEWEKYLSEP